MKNLKNKKVKIKGRKIYLKTLKIENATKEYCAWLNSMEVNKYLETRKTTIARLKRYIQEKSENPNCLFLGVFFKANQKHIGNIKLEPIDFKDSKAIIGVLIGEKDYWGRGIGTEATTMLVDYGFKSLNLKEVNLGVISENKAAIRVYEKAGFKVIGMEKNAIKHGRKLFDKVLMSIKK